MEKRIVSSSFKYRFIRSILIVLLMAYITTAIIVLGMIRSYFYSAQMNNLNNRIKLRADYYQNTYAPYTTLMSNIYEDRDIWWKEEGVRVQIYDTSASLILDSYGDVDKESKSNDVNTALTGIKGHLIYKDPVTSEHLLSVSYPLTSSTNQTVGVIRFISSLENVDNNIKKIAVQFLLLGGVVSTIAALAGIYMANKMIEPISDLTKTTQEMAKGNYSVRNIKKNNDEIGFLSDNFNSMADEIMKKEELKNDFISSVSHELRTPLTAIKGWAITLKDEETDKETLDIGLDIIENESDRLKAMVEELLDFSRFVSGKVRLNISNVNIDNLVTYLNHFLNERSKRENKIMNINVDQNLKTVRADENRLKQVLINLLDNAFKFTNARDSINLKIFQDTTSNYFVVEDTGIGIPAHEINKVKEKFFKGRHSKSQNGIGLTICEEIAKLHGGCLDIQSRYGEGTKVTLIIPKEVKANEEDI